MPTSVTPALRNLDGFSLDSYLNQMDRPGFAYNCNRGSKHIMDNRNSASVMPSLQKNYMPMVETHSTFAKLDSGMRFRIFCRPFRNFSGLPPRK
jgi:hypothetical protein